MSYSRESKENRLWSGIAVRMLMNSVSHPIEYAKFLIHIGYEPIDPKQTKTLFGKPALALPNIFQYVRYIKGVDGFTGCYRGLTPKLCAFTVKTIAIDHISSLQIFNEVIYPEVKEHENEDIDDLPDEQRKALYIREYVRELVSKIFGIIISHPLDVVTLRTMAQFVGGETKYNGVVQSLIQVYKENGIAGYYSGLIPRLLGEISTITIFTTLTYFINKYIVHDRNTRSYTLEMMKFLATTVTYPFSVVYPCMVVNNSGLIAGSLPFMPIFPSWIDCWRNLYANNQLKRGNSLLWRYYTGPQVIVNGKAIMINKF